ncbi:MULTISPECIES: SDR family oxidoreductase [Micromonospora]|uniref:SDR family oxidoreductase n=1 Tax=Micromonospora TaxID=1873 RepID=UPI0033E8C1CB
MKLDLNGRRVLVTGGTKGIGRAITLGLAEAGGRVIAGYHSDEDAAAETAAELKALGDGHHVLRADVTRPGDVSRLAEECHDRLGGLDVVVNNAGAISHVPFGELEPAEWHRVLDGNLTAAYLVVQRMLPLLGPGASIVNIGSKVAAVGIPSRAHYTAAKAGLIGLTRTLCKELGPRGIRINVVAPGVIESPAVDRLAPEQRSRYEGMTSLRRLGRPQEIAGVVAFLASDLAGYVTGETVQVDGGI